MELQWPLILFTSLLAWSAGLFAAMCLFTLKGEGKQAMIPAWITSAVLLVVAGISVFMHLEHWERIFNGFGHITSGITQELIGIVLLAVIAVVFLVMWKRNEGKVPAWVSIAGIVIALGLMVVCGLSYKMAARPAWNSLLEVLTLVGAACAMGPLTMIALDAITTKKAETGVFAWAIALVGTLVNAIATIVYVPVMSSAVADVNAYSFYFDNVQPTTGLVSGTVASSGTMAAIAIIGAAVAVIAAALCKKVKPAVVCIIGAIAALVGAIALRVVFYQMGISVFTLY